jgi:hypothetical protein
MTLPRQLILNEKQDVLLTPVVEEVLKQIRKSKIPVIAKT